MTYYKIDGVDDKFRSLRNAKRHVWIAYTHSERVKDLSGMRILKIVDDEVKTITPIIVTCDGYSFGRTMKV